jgi:tRNA modification GTPase
MLIPMLPHNLDETIIAISTPPGVGGLGIVRLSGPRALPLALRIFKPRQAKAKILPFRAVLGDLLGPADKRYDEGILTYFQAPRSYTREDIVEISCHGSPAVLEEAVRLGIKAGARHAHPGEFTLRAYLHGRIDIMQAEAVQSLISASSLEQARIAYGQLEGSLSSKIAVFREELVGLLARVEARLEFPDERIQVSAKQIVTALEEAIDLMRRLVSSHEAGRVLAEGVTLAIVGRTNVGKSTLFNVLVEKDRAIVTPFPGTTRDYLRERVRIGGTLFNLVDMAGLGKPSHPVEKEGMRRGHRLARGADGILLLLDSSRKEGRQDLDLLKTYGGLKTLIVLNKIDLPAKISRVRIRSASGKAPVLEVSALNGTNIPRLRDKLASFFSPKPRENEDIILHVRQKAILEQIQSCLESGLDLLSQGYSDEVYVEEIRKAIPLLGRLTGEIRSDEVIQNIFDRFCVGK